MQEFIVLDQSKPANTLLKKPAKKLDFPLSEAILKLIEDMKLTLLETDSLGVSANQIGHPIKLIVYHMPKEILAFRQDVYEDVPISVLINASYTPIAEEGMFSDWEGCFSIENTLAKVPRYNSIKYEGYTVDGKLVTGIARGFLARILQHEIDHTQGILFTDHLSAECLQGPEEEMLKIRKQEYDERKLQENEKRINTEHNKKNSHKK